MTPERQKWWDSLPANEKILRENLKAQRILLSVDKIDGTGNQRFMEKYGELKE